MTGLYSSASVCVVTSGLFADLATTLAKSFKTTYLYVPWESTFPRSSIALVGEGLKGVTKVPSIWPILDKVDLWVFPDIHQGPLQEHLASLGKRVWGSRMGECLELMRAESKEHFKALGLPLGEYVEVVGMDALREFVQDKSHEGWYVKGAATRGDFETFRILSYKLMEPVLDDIEHSLGPRKTSMRFVVEAPIDDAVEIGYDGFCVDGRYPSSVMCGIEVKNKSYVGEIKSYKELPEQLRWVNAKLSDTMKQYKYRNFWAAELRVTRDGTPYIIDPCCRAGSPPHELQQLMYTNLDEIFWGGASGIVVDPKPAAQWGASVMIESDWTTSHWQPLDIPPSVRDNVRLHYPVVMGGQYYTAPQHQEYDYCGAISAVGATLDEAIEGVRKVAKKIVGYDIEMPTASLDDAQGKIKSLARYNVRW